MSLTQNKVNKSFTKAFRDSFSRGQKQELKDYQLRQLPIGEGTFGKVMLGIHLATQEKVAIKILEKEKIEDEGDRQRILREIQILKLLKHPNIVQLYEIFEDEKRLYLIMEYAENGELFDYIVSKGKIKEIQAYGIEYIHKLNIVHRDLKPENLLLDDSMNIKLVDFGLSNLYKNEQKLQTACGSPCYAPPEMIKGQKYKGLPADIWSSGVILFALICGYLPFDDNDTQILYQKIISGDYSVPACISPEASDLLRKVLNVDPDKRYTIQQIKHHPWFNINKTYVSNPKGLIFGYHQIPLDNFLVDQVIKLGYDKESVVQSIINNRHNKATTMYYLLLKKFIKNGHVSCADIQSICFKPKLLQKKKQESKKDWDEEVKNILNKHHQKIQKKMSRKGKRMNDTSLKSYEQNIRKSIKGDSQIYKKMKKQSLFNTTKSKKKQRNRTVNIGQKEIFGSQRTNYSVTKEKKSTSKQKKNKKSRQNIYLINHQKLHKINKENTNSKRKKTATLFMTKKSINKNSKNQKLSFKQKKEDNYNEMNTHKGPLNLSSTTMKDPIQVFTNIKNLFKKIGVNCEKSARFKGLFKYKSLKCQLEIQKIDQMEKMYIIKFFRLNSEKKIFFEISQKLFQEIELQLIINEKIYQIQFKKVKYKHEKVNEF